LFIAALVANQATYHHWRKTVAYGDGSVRSKPYRLIGFVAWRLARAIRRIRLMQILQGTPARFLRFPAPIPAPGGVSSCVARRLSKRGVMVNVMLAAVAVAGWASAYDPGVMDATVAYRMEHGLWFTPPPHDWYQVAGYVAVNDCARVGEVATLVDPGGREWRVLVADCGGAEVNGGAAWMTTNNIVAELDAALWQRLTAAHGRPLAIEVRYDG
jgi:hypothetical protein